MDNKYNYKLLEELLFDATLEAYRLLSEIPVEWRIQPLTFFRPAKDGIEGYTMRIPKYRSTKILNRINEICKTSPKINSFYNYYMDGKDISIFKGHDRDSLIRMWFITDIHMPLWAALDKTAVSTFIKKKEIKQWKLSEDYLREEVKNRVAYKREINTGQKKYFSYCPILNPMIELKEVDIGYGIKIKKLSKEEKSFFMSYYSVEYLWDEHINVYLDHIAEIKVKATKDNEGQFTDVKKLVADKLDILKWAIMIVTKMDVPFKEGKCLIHSRERGPIGISTIKLSRQPDYNIRPPTRVISNSELDECRKLIEQYFYYADKVDGLKDALWHFGRAANASINRDILLESAIGIDNLVVPGGGDSRYRFCLHTSALLNAAGIDDFDFKLLKDIYSMRSQAAHGKNINKQQGLHNKACLILAKSIWAIIQLCNKEEIDSHNKHVSESIQDFVIKKLTK